jgi:hypothetical protein
MRRRTSFLTSIPINLVVNHNLLGGSSFLPSCSNPLNELTGLWSAREKPGHKLMGINLLVNDHSAGESTCVLNVSD